MDSQDFELILREKIRIQEDKLNRFKDIELTYNDANVYRNICIDEMLNTVNNYRGLLLEYRKINNYPGCTCCSKED